jgi:hypothetical protein
MSDMTRRHAIMALTGGAVVAVAGTATAGTQSSETVVPPLEDTVVQAAREAARRTEPFARPDAQIAEARVVLCRSWDLRVFLQVSDRVHGFAVVTEQAFALAAAAQAAGRRIAVSYWGHVPDQDGVGSFEGVLLALDVRDLPHHRSV